MRRVVVGHFLVGEGKYFFSLGIFILTLLLPIPGKTVESNPQIDSLKQLTLAVDNSSTETAHSLFKLAEAYRPLDLDSAMHYAQLSIEAYEDIFPVGTESSSNPVAGKKVLPYFLMANMHYAANRFGDSGIWIDKAEELMGRVDDDTLLGKVLYVKGNVLARLDLFEESIAYHNRAIVTNNQVQAYALSARSDLNKGRLYNMLEKPEMAVAAYDSAIRILRGVNDSVNLGIGILNKGATLMEMGDSVNGIANYEEAAGYFMTDPPSIMAVFALVNLGSHTLKLGNIELATSQLRKAEEIAEENGMQEARVASYRGMAGLMLNRRKFNQARDYLVRGWELLLGYGQLSDKIDLVEEWIEMEVMAGNYKEALRLERQRNEYQAEIRDLNRTQFIEELTVKYESETKEAENELLREREAKLNSRQKWIFALAGTVSFFLLTVIALLWRANQKRKVFNQKLEVQTELIEEKNEALLAQNELLQASNNEKDALMGVVAHDLKAPLTKITAMVDVLEQVKNDPVQFAKLTKVIKGVVGGGENLIEELVLMSSLEKSDLGLELVETRIVPLLELSEKGFQAQAESKEIALSLIVSDKSVKGIVHPDHFSRVIDNVLSNAIKFSPSGSKVDLELSSLSAQHFSISVRDNGPGIPAEELPRLFQKFSRLSPRPTAGESSTGLGLSIARELVHKMKGRIEVSTQVQVGTQFLLTFPRV